MALKVTEAKKKPKSTRGKVYKEKKSEPKVTAPFKKVIQAYITQKGRNDMAFQARINLKEKNIDDCIQYILNKVKESGMNGFADEEIYDMASHYYNEDKVKIGKKVNASTVVVNHTAGKKKNPKMAVAKKDDKEDTQISMF